jgi:hypothetical protein
LYFKASTSPLMFPNVTSTHALFTELACNLRHFPYMYLSLDFLLDVLRKVQVRNYEFSHDQPEPISYLATSKTLCVCFEGRVF